VRDLTNTRHNARHTPNLPNTGETNSPTPQAKFIHFETSKNPEKHFTSLNTTDMRPTPIIEAEFERKEGKKTATNFSQSPPPQIPTQCTTTKQLKQPDKEGFNKAMVKEVEGQQANGNWTVVTSRYDSRGRHSLTFRSGDQTKTTNRDKRSIQMKSRLNLDGSKTSTRNHLLGNLRSSGFMGSDQDHPDKSHHQRMENAPN